MFLWTSRSIGDTKENCYFDLQVSFQIRILFAPPTFLLVHRSLVFKIFYLCIFTHKKSFISKENTADNVVFGVFLLPRFYLVFLPSTLPSLPRGVMLLNCSTAPRDSATDIVKISRKGAPEGEQPDRSVVKRLISQHWISINVLSFSDNVLPCSAGETFLWQLGQQEDIFLCKIK